MLFLKDAPPVADRIGVNPMELRFTYVLAVVDIETRRPAFFVALEKSMLGANFLTTIDGSGNHSNGGMHPNLADEPAFIDWAVELTKEQFGIDDVRELRS